MQAITSTSSHQQVFSTLLPRYHLRICDQYSNDVYIITENLPLHKILYPHHP